MSLQFYIDHNVHAGIVEGLRARGVDCLTAMEDGMARADDSAVLARALEMGRVVFTQDVDFLELATAWSLERREFGGIIFARQMGITVGQAINDLELFAKIVDPAEIRNQVEWIPLG